MMRAGAFDAVVDRLGSEIVSGAVPAGHVESVEAIVARTGVSRSIVREAVRVLVDAGLLSARRRVGVRVQRADAWDALDARVIRWRLESPGRRAQLAELVEVRLAFEPAAAAAAAVRRTDAEASDLVDAAAALAAEGEAGTAGGAGTAAVAGRVAAAGSGGAAERFFAADVRFHALLLAASRNAMFVRLQSVVAEALRERSLGGHPHFPPSARDVKLHRDIAEAVVGRRPEEAAELTRALIAGTAP
ncbi:FadR/GntR family transcriptional regulator [Gryllotalpicola ginsengisoli]|uniref:FadR/GntR family transcriptional regulator n=1 Tax=Gryllotalpicola ginsengisoli TaxID=444608 RepID=UPI0003B53162|nr:FCD domain-containing protein [Gryllotalpicola ginsengisoli]